MTRTSRGPRRTAPAIRATALRADLYRLLDHVLETGQPVRVERKGKVLRIEPEASASKLESLLPQPDLIIGDPDDLVSIDWSDEWKP
ncbi:MAG: type II toxin-antitoxin system Phd/YefM family antitoxin [Myxococcales bacterium]|nr:type II toxin-antitoxin system Phd/YefM family antitoxin [Myxococcales bacterium]